MGCKKLNNSCNSQHLYNSLTNIQIPATFAKVRLPQFTNISFRWRYKTIFYVEAVGSANNKNIKVRLIPKKDAPKHLPIYEDIVKVTPIKVELNISNGGSDLDNGENAGNQGNLVADKDEENIGSYLLLNWDNDSNDDTFKSDLDKTTVTNEDNLAKLDLNIEPVLDEGIIELEIMGVDKDCVKLWKKNTKETEIVLTANKKTWDLSNATQKTELQQYINDSMWIEGVKKGTKEKGVSFTLKYKMNGNDICEDVCNATVVMINLGNAAYRDAPAPVFGRGHASLVTSFNGECTKDDLNNDEKFRITDNCRKGLKNTRLLFNMTNLKGYPARGCYTNPIITYKDRLKILKTAHYLATRKPRVLYYWGDALTAYRANEGNWDGRLSTIKTLRCDGVVEVCYEFNGIMVWGMYRGPSGTYNYDITNQSDRWSYYETSGFWFMGANGLPDNLEEHNDFDLNTDKSNRRFCLIF